MLPFIVTYYFCMSNTTTIIRHTTTRNAMESASADIAIGLHQENAFDPNAGLYLVRATDASRWLWRTMAAYLVKYPETWDQDLLGCLLRRHSPHGYLNSRAGCQTITTNDSSISGGAMAASSGFPHNVSLLVISNDVVVAASRPTVMRDTVAVHILTDKPLTSSRGKIWLAKELHLWEGAGHYYNIGRVHEATPSGQRPEQRRYLAYDGGVMSTNSIYMFHDLRSCQAVLLHMATIALITNRILVLPSVFDAQRHVYGAQFLDLKSLEVLGVEWRESSFLHNQKINFGRDASVSHAVIGPSLITMSTQSDHDAVAGLRERSRQKTTAPWNASAAAAQNPTPRTSTWSTRIPSANNPLEMWPAVWRELSADDSDILFIRLDERGQAGGGSTHPFPRERECFSAFGDKRDRHFWKRCATAPLIVEVQRSLWRIRMVCTSLYWPEIIHFLQLQFSSHKC